MGLAPLDTFRHYLQSLPEELLESVTEDYVWLAGLAFEEPTDFLARRECCRDEWARRGAPEHYEFARDVVSPYAA